MLAADFERRLVAIKWSLVERNGFGSIPTTILGMCRADADERATWRERLELCLLPQSGLGEGTSYAIPFLLEMLGARVASDDIYSVLVPIAICAMDFKDGGLAAKCRKELAAGLDVYLRDLADRNSPIGVRSLALDVICRLDSERMVWEPVLRNVYASEQTSVIGTEIREWLGTQDDPGDLT